MKKILTTVIAGAMMLACTSAFAQITIGAGYLNSNNKLSYSDVNNNLGNLNGVYAGVGYDISEGLGFGINTGLYYSYLAGKISFPGFSIVSGDLQEHALNIPFNFGYSVMVADGIKGFLKAGPTVVCGLSSHIKPLGLSIAETDIYKHKYLERFDLMLGGGFGVDINDMIRISLGYDFGLLDQIGSGLKGVDEDGNTRDSNWKMHRNRLNVGVALLF